MAPLAYTDTGARYAFYVLMGVFAASEWSIRFRSRRRHGGTRQDRGSFFVIIVTCLARSGRGLRHRRRRSRDGGIHEARGPIFVVGLVHHAARYRATPVVGLRAGLVLHGPSAGAQ